MISIRSPNAIAARLGREPYADAAPLENAFRSAFWDADRHLFVDRGGSRHVSLPGNVYAAFARLAPKGDADAHKAFLALVKANGYSTISFFQFPPLFCYLRATGENALLHDLLVSPDAWLRILREGGTRTVEGWGRDTKWNTSLFHLSMASAVLFLTGVRLSLPCTALTNDPVALLRLGFDCIREGEVIAVKRSDGTPGLSERTNWAVTSWFTSSSGTTPKCGNPIDIDYRQRERSVAVASEIEDGRLPRRNIAFAFGDNQRLSAKLYAALDNEYKGNTTNAWSKVVCLGDVKTGVDTLTVEKIPNPDHHTRVKFFVCDDLARSVSHTKTYKTGVGGLSILVR